VKAGADRPGDGTKAMPGAGSEGVLSRWVVFVFEQTLAQERPLWSRLAAAHRTHND
jgi:hypothetical protein